MLIYWPRDPQERYQVAIEVKSYRKRNRKKKTNNNQENVDINSRTTLFKDSKISNKVIVKVTAFAYHVNARIR